jgi:hypothetical protein
MHQFAIIANTVGVEVVNNRERRGIMITETEAVSFVEYTALYSGTFTDHNLA